MSIWARKSLDRIHTEAEAGTPRRVLGPVNLTTLGIGPGDEVIVPSYTFIASSFSIVQAGAVPRFADVNLDDHCLSVESAETLVTERTRAVMPVHLGMQIADMDAISEIARRHNLVILGDDLVDGELIAAGESICRIAIDAAERTTCQTNEYGRQADRIRFALQRKENFSETKGTDF